MLADFESLPDSSRLWVHASRRELAPDEAGALLAAIDAFLAGWTAHGSHLKAARSLRHNRFLLIAADSGAAPPSGCSLDALAGELRRVGGRLGTGLLGHDGVWYRDDGGSVRHATRGDFRAQARAGAVTPATVVFDNSIATLAELRAGGWEGPARDRWHAIFFDAT